MTKNTSIYLDIVRFLAALTVMMSHVSTETIGGGLLWRFHDLGAEAVTVFFVLSGFVIAYVVETREQTISTYAANRAARIYSVAIPAIALTLVLDTVGRHFRPHLYDGTFLETSVSPLSVQLLSNLLFLREVWFLHIDIGSNFAFWSIGYEVWYYLIFAAWFFAARKYRVVVTLLAMVAAGPKIVSMLPLWLLGVLAYAICTKRHLPRWLGGILAIGSALVWLTYELWAAFHGRWRLDLPDQWTRGQELPELYLVGCLFFLNVIGFRFLAPGMGSIFGGAERRIRWVAGATFTMYLTHVPILVFLTAISPWPVASVAHHAFILVVTPTVVFLLAEVTERRKDSWRRAFHYFSRTLSRQGAG